MKVQIRRSVFETNSSTNHTLAIKKVNIYDVPMKLESIKFANTSFNQLEEKFYDDVVNLHELSLQEKVDILFYSTLALYNDGKTVLEDILRLQDILKKYNIEVSINWDKLRDNLDNYFDTSIFSLVSQRLEKEEDIIQFLFSDEAYYTEYCDECCTRPSKEIEDIDNLAYGNNNFIYITERM